MAPAKTVKRLALEYLVEAALTLKATDARLQEVLPAPEYAAFRDRVNAKGPSMPEQLQEAAAALAEMAEIVWSADRERQD